MITKVNFSTFLKEIKNKGNLTNQTLAKYMQRSEASVSLYLSGRSIPTYEKLLSLKENLLSLGL